MEAKIEAVLKEFDERHAAETRLMQGLSAGEIGARVDEFLIPVGHEVGRFLHDLAASMNARRILEFGTSYGYSALWLAMAARSTGGKLVSLEVAAEKQQYARAKLTEAGLSDHVDFITGDALEIAIGLEGPFDLVLIDLWKHLYIPCFDVVLPKLASPSYVVADNIIFPQSSSGETEAYCRHVRSKADQSLLLPLGNGIEVSRFAN